MTAVWVALIVAVSSMAGPMLLERQRRRDRAEDLEREEAVRLQAQEAARLLEENNALVEAQAADTRFQLAEIHVAVNSNMTEQMRERLIALNGWLVMLQRQLESDSAAGRTSTKKDLSALKAVTSEIAELEAALADRLEPAEEE